MPKAKRRKKGKDSKEGTYYLAGYSIVQSHPLFAPLCEAATIHNYEKLSYPADGHAFVTSDGHILCNPKSRAAPGQWARAIAHCLLHLAMDHFVRAENPYLWNIACDCVVEKFLTDMKFGTPLSYGAPPEGVHDEDRLYRRLLESPNKTDYCGFGTAGKQASDMLVDYRFPDRSYGMYNKPDSWSYLFARGLAAAVRSAVRVASGEQEQLSTDPDEAVHSTAYRAKQWFLSSYPLLGAIAAGFKLIEDPLVCRQMSISVAAISASLSELYINPGNHLSDMEARFVLAHEFLHAALRHDARQEWRDAYLWNVACDYVINQWLSEMGVGERPYGVLYDEQFKGMNAEAVYDRIVTDMRYYRKLATLRGVGLGDILPGSCESSDSEKGAPGGGMDLDAFYRRAIAQGLSYHQECDRGYLPEGLIEEIKALSHPPIPWDVELARWFDELFSPIEKTRSYARPSRRQSSTPDIPRPYLAVSQAAMDGRTFGVVLDTSGSMGREMLATALGAVAAYSASRDVPAARVVFCDAEAYDAGYMKPEEIAGTVKVKGRGGTVLQPGINLLDKAEDFPDEAPILIITDGQCDRVVLYGREHAFLIPQGANLPFGPKGKIFRMR